MKKTNLIVLLLLALFVYSCSDKEKETVTPDDPNYNVDLVNPDYTDKTSSQIKGDLEDQGVEMVAEVSSFSKEPGIAATVSLMDVMGGSSSENSMMNMPEMKIMAALSAVGQGKGDFATVLSSLKSAKVESEESLDLDLLFNQLAGDYTYNYTLDTVIFTAKAGDLIRFIFPSNKKKPNVNDAVIEIARPEYQTGNFVLGDQPISKLPKKASVKLKVQGNDVIVYALSASYTSEGIPVQVVTSLSVGTFKFEVKWGYTTSEVNVGYSLTHGAKNLISMGMSADGSFAIPTIEKSEGPEDVVDMAKAYLQFMDVKIVGSLNVKNLAAVGNDSTLTWNENSVIDTINNNVGLVIFYASTNKAIAKAEAYWKTVEETYYDYWQDKYVTETHKEIDFRMVFKDGSKATLETYFQNGFSEMVTSMNNLIAELNEAYGFNLEPMEVNQPTAAK